MNSLRIDRLLTLYFFNPLLRILSQRNELRIPILMYHSISYDSMEGVHPYFETNTSPKVFANHMKYLYENGYNVINLEDVVEHLRGEKILSKKSLVITFDDGFRDFYIQVIPILKHYNFSATMFLPTAFIDNKRLQFKGKECLTWQEVRELCKKKIIFGSHTANHIKLYMLKREEIEAEIRMSKNKIENEIGNSIDSFSYPYSFPEQDTKFIQMLTNLLEKNGYKNGVSTIIGTNTKKNNLLFLKRIPMNTFDDNIFLKAKLEGGYDWLHKFQYFYKKIKRLR